MSDHSAIQEVEYRPIDGFPGYRVGDDGTTWSCWAYNGRNPRRLSNDWKRMKPTPDGDGYLSVGLYRDGKARRRKIHLLVIETFIGPRPSSGLQACHENGVVSDCRRLNLRWDTGAGNQRDRLKHGTESRGSKNGHARLTEAQVVEIRAAIAGGQAKKDIAARFSVSPSTISAIARGANWSWV